MWIPSRCIGSEIVVTFAPARSSVWAASCTIWSTSFSDAPSQPNPSLTRASLSPLTLPLMASLYVSVRTSRWRGSSPSGPAMASRNTATSATVRAIGPVWSRVSSIGKTPV